MAFHPEKRTTLPVTRARKVLKYPYQLHGHILETTDSAKYLGVTINKDWAGTPTSTTSTGARANKSLGFSRKNLNIGLTSIKQTAYKSIIRPILDYASMVWDPHTQCTINKIEAIQWRAARYVLRHYRNTSGVKDMLEELQ